MHVHQKRGRATAARALLLWAAALLTSARVERALADDAPATFIAGRILGASGSYEVRVALWDARGFLVRPAQELRLPPGAETTYRFVVRPGRWAVSAFEDRNGNGVLDQGTFGPKEPSGFWRPFHAWHKPAFDEVASSVERPIADADVTLK